MKRKEYEKLLDKIEEANLVYGGLVLEHADYNETRQPLSFKDSKIEMDKAKKVLDGYKAELDDILTVDMGAFADKFLTYINSISNRKYVVDSPKIDGVKLWIARPIDRKTTTFYKLITEAEDMFVLGAGDKKVIPHQAVYIGGMQIPTMYGTNNKYFSAYNLMQGKYDVKYRQFEDTFMKKLEEELVEVYIPKRKNKR